MSETPILDTMQMKTELQELHTRLQAWADLLDKQINPEASQHVRACAILVYDILTRLVYDIRDYYQTTKLVRDIIARFEAKERP